MRVSTTSTFVWHMPGPSRRNAATSTTVSIGAFRHGSTQEVRRKKIRQGGKQACRVCDAQKEKRHAEKWTQREESHESQAGNCDRSFGSKREGREGSAKEELGPQIDRKEIRRPEIDEKEIDC